MVMMDREVMLSMSNPTVHSMTIFRIYRNNGKDRVNAAYGTLYNAVRGGYSYLKRNQDDSVRIDSVKIYRRSMNDWGVKASSSRPQGVIRNSIAKIHTSTGITVNTFYTDPKGKCYALTTAGNLGRRLDRWQKNAVITAEKPRNQGKGRERNATPDSIWSERVRS